VFNRYLYDLLTFFHCYDLIFMVEKHFFIAPNRNSDLPQQKNLIYHIENQAFNI